MDVRHSVVVGKPRVLLLSYFVVHGRDLIPGQRSKGSLDTKVGWIGFITLWKSSSLLGWGRFFVVIEIPIA